MKLLWLLEFLAEKVLEFFHGLSFFRLEFFGYREKKACNYREEVRQKSAEKQVYNE